ncbi:hypothetical protein [Clostridium sp. DJ247]|uniref:hypothetical protein n=1 Tax=Clostridium sp. DJ247 TaxID=2726188 RepID=UPI00162445D2|nr:hypothetical protein [Clostridium sp. DJ247]MBC2579161.1 hypothetical protein [Clostridium sp. DJ247]
MHEPIAVIYHIQQKRVDYGSTAKGMVTMTPSFSPDGKKVIFLYGDYKTIKKNAYPKVSN